MVQQLLQKLYDKGEIYRTEYDGWYCVACERFFVARELPELKCPECGRTMEQLKESNYFFRMSAYQQWLIRKRDRADCFRAFINNQWFGLVVFAVLVLFLLDRAGFRFAVTAGGRR